MNRIKKLMSIGGDDRSRYMIKRLNESGIFTDSRDDMQIPDEFDGIILPLPVSDAGGNIKGTMIKTEDLCSLIDETKTVFAGKIKESDKNILLSRGITVYDYYARPEFAAKNSIPTAQGVLLHVLQNSAVTVNNLKIGVTGYGNCGRAICKLFKGTGADVISASRRYITLAEAESEGIKSVLIKDIPKILPYLDVVINTVPAMIFKKEFTDSINDSAMIIDIASYPYGFDMKYARSAGKNITLLPSLPGKAFPETAGNIIAETIINIIEEEGL